MSAERALIAAIRAAAMADTGVKALVGDPARIYDDAPEGAVFPYVTLGRVESRAADAASVQGIEHALTLHVWSRYGGRAEALDIIGALRAALHNASLTLTGHRLVLLYASFADVFRAGDAQTTHGVLRLRAVTEPN
ncbi:MAG: DUF3168 domain-containing protein [Hyphomonadaceae bacterium]|nr:DUF3168 domain-containing protein [Hyphomonadaceae bacterium]